MIKLSISAFTPLGTVKSITEPLPSTVTRLVSVAPLPVVGPEIVVFVGMTSVPLVRVMVFSAVVFAALKSAELKLIFTAPTVSAANSASRRLHEESVPVPGVVCCVQFPADPVSSRWVVTTKFTGGVLVRLKSMVVNPAAAAVTV